MTPLRTSRTRLSGVGGLWLLAGALLVGCGDAFDELAWACIDLDGPEFVTGDLPGGTVGQPYSAVVTAEIVREPYDDAYVYSFTLDGPLPPGLQIRRFQGQRRIEIFGTPSTVGTHSFTLSVSVQDPDAWAGATTALCWYRSDKSYQIVVAPNPNGAAKSAVTLKSSFERSPASLPRYFALLLPLPRGQPSVPA